ncbi:hypothetical protein [Flavobacterium microcysteis]
MTKIKFKRPVLLVAPELKQNLEIDSPLLSAKFNEGDTIGKEKWTLGIVCSLRVSQDSIEKSIGIFMDEGINMMGILPIKKIFMNKIVDTKDDVENLWYIETEEFELDEFYNIIELSIDDNLASCGKKRGGKTVGIYTSLSKL